VCAAAQADHIVVSREALEGAGRRLVALQKLVLKGIKDHVEAAEINWVGEPEHL
jgi:class 3 adenylate cyclase